MNLIPNNPSKKIEAIYIEKFININKINIKVIKYNEYLNINQEIIKTYKDKPDLLIINFSNGKPDIIKNIPKPAPVVTKFPSVSLILINPSTG